MSQQPKMKAQDSGKNRIVIEDYFPLLQMDQKSAYMKVSEFISSMP